MVRFTKPPVAYTVGYNKVTLLMRQETGLKGYWFYSGKRHNKGVYSGRFAPRLNVTRADFLVMVMRGIIKPDKK